MIFSLRWLGKIETRGSTGKNRDPRGKPMRELRGFVDRGEEITSSVFPHLRFMHRRGNLEDLFLKLTGREMRE
jgi:hypothetical protein